MFFSNKMMGIFPERFKIRPLVFHLSDKEYQRSEKGRSTLVANAVCVLMADDDEDDRELFKEAIDNTELNVKLEIARDGKELIEKLHTSSKLPDVIVLDLNMPYKSGKECLELIRKNPEFKEIPIVIYSTSSALKDIEETYQKGANLYISKPSSFNEMIKIVRNVILIDWDQYPPKNCRDKFYFSLKKT